MAQQNSPICYICLQMEIWSILVSLPQKIQKLFKTTSSTQPGDGISRHPFMSRKQVLLLSSSGAKWAAQSFVVLHEQKQQQEWTQTVLNLPCSNLKAMGQLNYSPKARKMKHQYFSEPWRTSCWCLTADWHEGNPLGFSNSFSLWPLN